MRSSWIAGAVALALLGATLARADGPKIIVNGQEVVPGQPMVITGSAEIQPLVVAATAEAKEASDVLKELGPYWIGLAASQPGGALRAQLGLANDEGLVVENVAPESPAAKAGLQQHDVLLSANGKKLGAVVDLTREINAVKEGKLFIELIRGGKRQKIDVAPAKRPPGQKGGVEMFNLTVPPEGADAKKIEEWLKKFGVEGGARRRLPFHVIHPGQIVPPGVPLPGGAAQNVQVTVATSATLPDGYKVEIVRENDKPARITVTREKEKWEATEADLSKLPEKVRPEVQRMLHQGAIHFGTVIAPPMGALRVEGPLPDIRPFVGRGEELDKRLDEMNRQIEQLRKSVEEMRGRTATPKEKKHAK